MNCWVGNHITDQFDPKVVDFYNQINLLYGSITEFCSPSTCPEMKATDEYDATATLPDPN